MARADRRGLQPQQMLPQYRQECAACHLAYPPGMLPARSWNRIMGGLDRHYGTDASLDAATVAQIGKWLEGNAGATSGSARRRPTTITRSAWFGRKHRELDATVWRLASVRRGQLRRLPRPRRAGTLRRARTAPARRPAGSLPPGLRD